MTSETFWRMAEPWLARPEVTKSTMMGFPCLRRDGTFFACTHRSTGELIVKLSRDRVADLVAHERGEPFAPNGRVFRQWVLIPQAHDDTWPARIEEAYRFAREAD